MDAAADELLRLAFDRAPALEANQAMARIREQEHVVYPQAVRRVLRGEFS